jgi:hypothetical protein
MSREAEKNAANTLLAQGLVSELGERLCGLAEEVKRLEQQLSAGKPLSAVRPQAVAMSIGNLRNARQALAGIFGTRDAAEDNSAEPDANGQPACRSARNGQAAAATAESRPVLRFMVETITETCCLCGIRFTHSAGSWVCLMNLHDECERSVCEGCTAKHEPKLYDRLRAIGRGETTAEKVLDELEEIPF